jgi:hypothetical protein
MAKPNGLLQHEDAERDDEHDVEEPDRGRVDDRHGGRGIDQRQPARDAEQCTQEMREGALAPISPQRSLFRGRHR